jgi:hypothetical protein
MRDLMGLLRRDTVFLGCYSTSSLLPCVRAISDRVLWANSERSPSERLPRALEFGRLPMDARVRDLFRRGA